uniref:PLD phosphodiesterase domain-containing protein n=1 Tax=Glossina palpalis gambiensis TaxID=67801 RepID=A0A1B0C3P7_9MUSC
MKMKYPKVQHTERAYFQIPLEYLTTTSVRSSTWWHRACCFIIFITSGLVIYSIFRNGVVKNGYAFNGQCSLQLVESIPDGLNYSENSPKFLSTYNAWKILINFTEESLNITSFYWTIEPTAISNNSDTEILQQIGAAEVRSVNFTRLLDGGVLHTKLWVVDNKHFYLGSANMDWRSLTQVKELGVLGINCKTLSEDFMKIFNEYWYLGNQTANIPKKWPKEYSTNFNFANPIIVNSSGNNLHAVVSSSPPPLTSAGRVDDLECILKTINDAKSFVYVAVMDYYPLIMYTENMRYWPFIDDALRKVAIENKVKIKLLISWWRYSSKSENYFLKSLTDLTKSLKGVDIQVRLFIVPINQDQLKIPHSRVNHNKYMVTDNAAYIGTSNWSGDYFTDTAGIGLYLQAVNNSTSAADDLSYLEAPSIGTVVGDPEEYKAVDNVPHPCCYGVPDDDIPRLITWAAWAEESVNVILDSIEEKPLDAEFIGLLHNIQNEDVTRLVFRGYRVFAKNGNTFAKSLVRCVHHYSGIKRPIFRKPFERCHKALASKGLILAKILASSEATIFENILYCFVGIEAVQIAIVNLLRSLNMKPDYIIGVMACGYADGGFTAHLLYNT